MNIKLELLSGELADLIAANLDELYIDVNKIVDTTATKMIGEIQAVLKGDANTDFDIVEEIVCIFEKYNVDAGSRHDF